MGAPSNQFSKGKDEAVSSKNFWCFSFDKTPWEKGWSRLGREAFKKGVGCAAGSLNREPISGKIPSLLLR